MGKLDYLSPANPFALNKVIQIVVSPLKQCNIQSSLRRVAPAIVAAVQLLTDDNYCQNQTVPPLLRSN